MLSSVNESSAGFKEQMLGEAKKQRNPFDRCIL